MRAGKNKIDAHGREISDTCADYVLDGRTTTGESLVDWYRGKALHKREQAARAGTDGSKVRLLGESLRYEAAATARERPAERQQRRIREWIEDAEAERRAPRDVALVGRTGSGKTTIAKELARSHGYTHLSLGKAIRDVAERIYGTWARDDRTTLQRVGNALDAADPGIWSHVLVAWCEALWSLGWRVPVVVDDVRRLSEVEILRDAGFRIVRVEADAEARHRRLWANGRHDGDLDDASESALDVAGRSGSEDVADVTIHNGSCADVGALAQVIA